MYVGLLDSEKEAKYLREGPSYQYSHTVTMTRPLTSPPRGSIRNRNVKNNQKGRSSRPARDHETESDEGISTTVETTSRTSEYVTGPSEHPRDRTTLRIMLLLNVLFKRTL